MKNRIRKQLRNIKPLKALTRRDIAKIRFGLPIVSKEIFTAFIKYVELKNTTKVLHERSITT